MGRGTKIINNHIGGFQEEIQKVSTEDVITFFNWFDESGGDVDTNFIKGQCEFSFSILMPLLAVLKDTRNKTALEIGYGGGRLLAAAAQVFKKVVGVDIHKNSQIVADEFKRRNIHNFELLQNNGNDIPVKDASIDLVYSFIVFQHIEKIATFHNYLAETYRVLKKDCHAVLFFGRLSLLSKNRKLKLLYHLDRFLETIDRNGYREVPAQVNRTNLRISITYAKRKAQEQGFFIVGDGVSRKLPDFYTYGGQNFLILKK